MCRRDNRTLSGEILLIGSNTNVNKFKREEHLRLNSKQHNVKAEDLAEILNPKIKKVLYEYV